MIMQSKIDKFEEIEAPKHVRYSAKQKKGIVLGSIILVASAISVPFLILYLLRGEEKGARFDNLLLISTSGGPGQENSSTFKLTFKYINEYDASFIIDKVSVNVSVRPKLTNPSQWTHSFQANSYDNFTVSMEKDGTYILETYFTVKDTDVEQKFFLKSVLMKSDDIARFVGKMNVKIGSKTGEAPDIINFDTKEEINTMFAYSISENGPSTFTIYDLHTYGDDPLNASRFDLKVNARYENPFNFPVRVENCTMRITDKQNRKNYGDFSIQNIGDVRAKNTTNFTAMLVMDPIDISLIVSLLLNGTTDVFYMRNLITGFSIGNITITGNRSVEVVQTDLKFVLTLQGMRPALNGNLITNVLIEIPCNITFNISYVFLEMFVAGTKNKVLTIDQVIDTGNGKLLCLPYTTNKIENIELNVKYDTFIQHARGQFDLFGYLNVDCFNYNGRIYFGSYNVTLLTA